MARRKKNPNQPELPITPPGGTKPPSSSLNTSVPAPANANGNSNASTPGKGNGNGDAPGAHVIAEAEAAPPPPRILKPGNIELALHRRVDTGFLQYASYVIRDRAIPNLEDGLKPVQRRILWALKRMDDGRLIKVATVSGEAMKYHPHGQAAIDDALVVLANKRYLIEGQGNYGNMYTGDPAAASR